MILKLILHATTVMKTFHLNEKVQQNILSQKQADYITEIVGRMKWYGLMQIFSRLESMWYYYDADSSSPQSSRYVHSLTTLYFFVFLYVQS